MTTSFKIQLSVIIAITILILIFLALIWSGTYDVKSGGGIAILILFLVMTTSSMFFMYTNKTNCEIKKIIENYESKQ
jgi:hypothetical protein